MLIQIKKFKLKVIEKPDCIFMYEFFTVFNKFAITTD